MARNKFAGLSDAELERLSLGGAQSFAQPQPQQQEQGGFADKMMNDPLWGGLTNMVLGAGDVLPKFAYGMTGREFQPSSEGSAYSAGNMAGNLALWAALSRVGMGGLAKLGAGGRAATAGAPVAGNVANLAKSLAGSGTIPSMLRGATAGGVIGAADNPNDPLSGAAWGAAAGGAIPGLSPLKEGVGKLWDYANVNKYAKELFNKLGGGTTIQGNAEAFAKMVRNKVGSLRSKYENTINPILDSFKERNDFPSDYWAAMKEEEPTWNGEIISTQVKNMANKLVKDKDLESAHDLQKQLGHEMSYLKRKIDQSKASPQEVNMYHKYTDWYHDTKQTITDYIGKDNPENAAKWQKASDFYRDRIAPFHSDPMLSRVAKGELENPIGFHKIFEAPESEMKYVIKALGEPGKGRTALSYLGQPETLLEPETMRKSLLGMEGSAGLESSMPKNTKDMAEELRKRIIAHTIKGFGFPQIRRWYYRI